MRMGNIQNGNVDFSDLKYVKSEAVPEDFLLQQGDVLFNRTNSPELVGKCAVYAKTGRATFASYLLRLQVNADLLAPQFLASWINSSWGRSWARAVRTDGVSQSNINATKLALMPLPLPPLREQHEIVRRTIALLDTAEALDRQLSVAIRSTKRLGDSVLVKAFRGELSGIAAAEGALR
jgi:type I restriction enzyme S subunit